jgi:hypothetical protein
VFVDAPAPPARWIDGPFCRRVLEPDAGDAFGLDERVEVDADTPDVVDDLSAGVAVQRARPLVTDVDVVATASGEDDGEVLEAEVPFEEVQ